MQKRSWIFLSLAAVTVTAGLLLAGTPASEPAVKKSDNSCCKVKVQDCIKKQKANTSGKMIMESLSTQFLLISPF